MCQCQNSIYRVTHCFGQHLQIFRFFKSEDVQGIDVSYEEEKVGDEEGSDAVLQTLLAHGHGIVTTGSIRLSSILQGESRQAIEYVATKLRNIH